MENQQTGDSRAPEAAPPRDHGGQHDHPHPDKPARDMSHIQGWGADLAHENRPAYPMARTPPRLDNVHWTQPEDQPITLPVFHSIERPGVTPLFGTSTPPKGLSGLIRRFAYRMSENDVRHWMLLLLADRVNVVEGIGEDLMRGKVPNVFAEMGAGAELKHNPAGFARKAAIATVVVGAGIYLMRKKNPR